MSIDKGKDGFLCSILALSLTLVLKPRAGTALNNKTWSEFWTRDLLALQLQRVHTGDRLQSHIVFWWSLLEISPVVLCWCFKPPNVHCKLMASYATSDILNAPNIYSGGSIPLCLFASLSTSLSFPPSPCFLSEADLLMKLHLWQSVSRVFSIYDYGTLLCLSELEAVTHKRRNNTHGSDINSLWS